MRCGTILLAPKCSPPTSPAFLYIVLPLRSLYGFLLQGKRSNLKKLKEGDVKERYQVTIRKFYAAPENLEDNGNINRAWDNIRKNIKFWQKSVGFCESKHRKEWFDEECSKLIDRSKQAKLQWSQAPSKVNEDNPINLRLGAIRHFRNKKREYLKDRKDERESDSKNKNIREM
jgi:hypothetical protein